MTRMMRIMRMTRMMRIMRMMRMKMVSKLIKEDLMVNKMMVKLRPKDKDMRINILNIKQNI